MDSSRESLHALLIQYVNTVEAEKLSISETTELLAKVDIRRRQNPIDRRRWNARADVLEASLFESQRRLNWLNQSILETERKLEALDSPEAALDLNSVEEIGEEPAAAKEFSRSDLMSPQQAGAQRILDLPLFKVKDAPLEDFALAKSFRDTGAPAILGKEKTDELIKRIGIYDRSIDNSKRTARKGPTQEERRHQMLIRRALDKCRSNQMGALTLDDIDLIIGCYDMLMQGSTTPDEGDRLLELINRAIDHICNSWSKLEILREAMDVHEEGSR